MTLSSLEEVLIDFDPGGLVWTGLDADDDLALLMAIALNRTRPGIRIVGVTVCGGNAPIKHTSPGLDLLLRTAGVTSADFQHGIARGYGWRDMHVAWPKFRKMNRLSPDWPSSDAAADLIIRAAHASGPNGLTVLTLGPATNLARALAKDPGIEPRLRRVILMGGELTGGKMCLNFASDRASARAVLASSVPTMLVPIQTCAQVAFTSDDVGTLEARCCSASGDGEDSGEEANGEAAACALLKKARLQTRVMPWLVNVRVAPRLPDGSRWRRSSRLQRGFIPWDVVALLAAFKPWHFGAWEAHKVEMPRCAHLGGREPCDATMRVEPTPVKGLVVDLEDGLVRADMTAAEDEEEAAQSHAKTLHSRAAWRDVALIPHLVRSERELVADAISLLCAVPAARVRDAKGGRRRSARPALLLGFLREAAVAVACVLGTVGALVTGAAWAGGESRGG